MANVQKTFDPKNMDALRKHLLLEAADMGVRVTREQAPERTGRLKSTVRAETGQNHVNIIVGGSQAPYARFLEFGTRPHRILPRYKKALRFETEEGIVFARRVMHPGVRGLFYLKRAAEMLGGELAENLGRLVKEVF